MALTAVPWVRLEKGGQAYTNFTRCLRSCGGAKLCSEVTPAFGHIGGKKGTLPKEASFGYKAYQPVGTGRRACGRVANGWGSISGTHTRRQGCVRSAITKRA